MGNGCYVLPALATSAVVLLSDRTNGGTNLEFRYADMG
jgi:hypothetical protein